MLIDEAIYVLSHANLVRITNTSAKCYPTLVKLGCIFVRRKRGEAWSDMLIRLAIRFQPFDREFSRDEVQLLYSRGDSLEKC